MSRFAKIEEAAITRHAELTGEELRLYMLIKYHTWNDSGVCNKNLHELCKIYGLNYNHTTERYKSLRKKGWCDKTKKGIRPIAGLKTPKSGVFKTPENGVFEDTKLQKAELETPENGVFEDTKLQKAEFSLLPYIEPFKDESFTDDNNTEKSVVVVGKPDGRQSQFSIAECRRYVELCADDGQTIKNRFGLADYLFRSGEKDALILARLYPEEPTAAPVDKEFADALEILLDLRSAEMDISDLEHYYAPTLWARLMEEVLDVESER